METEILQQCQQAIGYEFNDPQLLHRALTHASVATVRLESNERLEFLGDAVLGLVICEQLYRDFEDYHEGDMTKIKSAAVSRKTCAQIAEEIGISDMLFLGKGIEGRSVPSSIAAAVMESIIGAIYLDGGLEPAREFILRTMRKRLDAIIDNRSGQNYKSQLQQYAQKRWSVTPGYLVLDEKGPDHAKAFEVCVVIEGRRFAGAWGNNKKDSEQRAARLALEELSEQDASLDAS